MKIKIFSEGGVHTVQSDVQQWLDAHPQISINTILQSECYVGGEDGRTWSLTITIFYIE